MCQQRELNNNRDKRNDEIATRGDYIITIKIGNEGQRNKK